MPPSQLGSADIAREGIAVEKARSRMTDVMVLAGLVGVAGAYVLGETAAPMAINKVMESVGGDANRAMEMMRTVGMTDWGEFLRSVGYAARGVAYVGVAGVTLLTEVGLAKFKQWGQKLSDQSLERFHKAQGSEKPPWVKGR